MKGSSILSRLTMVFIIFGVVFSFMGFRDLIYSSKTPGDYNSMLEADFKKGMIIEGDAYANLGAFEENYTTRNGVKTGNSHYNYMIPVGEKQYMGLLNFTSTQEAELEAQADATFAYWNGETAEEPALVHFKGIVKEMDNETKGYMQSYMLDIGFTQAEVNELILPYYIKCDNYDGWLWQIVTGIICLVIGLAIVLVPILSANKKKDVMFANGSSVNNSQGGAVIKDDFDSFRSASYETNNSVFDNTASQNNVFENTDSVENSYSSKGGLGMGIADDYKPEEGKSNSSLSLKLKDD